MRWKVFNVWDWNRWFAWYPIVINDERVWLEYVERKLTFESWAWQFRLVNGSRANS